MATKKKKPIAKKASNKKPKKVIKKKTKRKKKSASHVKGWVTRRLNRQEQVLLAAARKGDKKLLISLLGLDIPEWLRKMPPEIAEQYANFAEKVREEKWVAYQDPEYTYSGKLGAHRYARGAIAVTYSRARHLGKATDEALRMIRKANKQGAKELDRVVKKISLALNLPVREIYTLWFSP